MFEDYLATQRDLKTIKEGLRFILHPKMRFVFKNESKIVKTIIVSYDSKFIYIWELNPIRLTYRIPHNLKIPDGWQRGWWADVVSKQIKKYLPEKDNNPIICGGFLTPFIALQKAKNVSKNPYITKESYLATIVHEFGHVYFGGFGKNGELSAFCTEYYASTLFWPDHVKKLDKFIEKIGKDTPDRIKENNQHIFALLNAKKLIAHYPKSWPKRLLE